MTKFLKRKIINGRLNVTSGIFVAFSLVIGLFIPFIALMNTFSTSDIDSEKTLTTIIVPTTINMLIIPLFKFVSFHQEIEDKLIIKPNEENKKYLKNKQIVYTECFLMFASSMPIMMWYVLEGYKFLMKHHFNIAVIISVCCWIIFVTYIITIIYIYGYKTIKQKIKK